MVAGNAAVGLWVRCAAWSAQQLTDGRIPADIVAGFGNRREIDRLTAARLWVPVGDEYVIADWLEYQPSALEVKERRKRDADRKRAERAHGYAAVARDPVTGRFRKSPGGE